VVLKLCVLATCGCEGYPGNVQVVTVAGKFGFAVLDAAAGAAVRAVLIKFAGKTVETLAIKPPRKVVES
jgi:hypothetical protein